MDELLIKLNPIVLGAGIPLFSGRAPPAKLRLEEERTLPAGVALLVTGCVRDRQG